jgi:lipopolysaccharide transport system permease protein
MLLTLRRFFGITPQERHGGEKWVVEPRGVGAFARIEELWYYRRTFWFLANRARKRIYQRMTLGVFWVFGRPLMPILFGTVIFGALLGIPSDGLPYFLFFLTGMSSWMMFERGLMWATRSLQQNRGLLKKVYFPRLLVPLASVAPIIVEFGVYMGLLAMAFVYYRVTAGIWYLHVSWGLLVALLAQTVALVLVIGIGFFTALAQARHRDVRYGLRYFLRFWSYGTPLLYPMSQVPEQYQWLMYMNPMASIVQTFKWGVLGVDKFPAMPLLWAATLSAGVFVLGFWYFGRTETATLDKL